MRLRLKRVARLLGIALVALLAIVIGRTLLVRSRQPLVGALSDPQVDATRVGEHLGGAVRQKTVSVSTEELAPADELAGLHAHLARAFPKVQEKLGREVIGGHSLLYEWKGSGGEAPIILCAHQDVVPVEAGTEARWSSAPFGGAVDGEFVWGRGAFDDKGSLIAILEAVESLLSGGFAPRRTVYLAFGHDEEVSGREGAMRIVDRLAERGVRAEAVLDEGLAVIEGIVPSIAGPVAAIGIAEKGYLTLKLSVDLPGGHSSTPPTENALGVLEAGLARLRSDPMPARLDGATAAFFEWLAPEMSFGQRAVLSNTWLTWPLVSRMFAKKPALDATIRTTTAITVLHAGVKDNVVPRTAEALVNFRVLPGDTTDGVIAHVRRALDDARISIEPQPKTRAEPTRVARTDSRVFGAITRSIRDVVPSSVVGPALVLGATDGRHYERVADDVYRFLPFRLGPDDLARIHGTNERLALPSLVEGVRFYRQFLRLAAGS